MPYHAVKSHQEDEDLDGKPSRLIMPYLPVTLKLSIKKLPQKSLWQLPQEMPCMYPNPGRRKKKHSGAKRESQHSVAEREEEASGSTHALASLRRLKWRHAGMPATSPAASGARNVQEHRRRGSNTGGPRNMVWSPHSPSTTCQSRKMGRRSGVRPGSATMMQYSLSYCR